MPDLLKFLLILASAYAVPGPDLVLVAQAARESRGGGARTAAGTMCGLILHAALAAVGAAALIARHPEALAAVRVVGGIYLLHLGLRVVRHAADASEGSGRIGFRAGLLTNVLNPKAVVFFLVIIPSFATTAFEATVLAGVTVVFGAVWWSLFLTLFARRADRSRRSSKVDRLLGGMIMLFGAGLVLGA